MQIARDVHALYGTLQQRYSLLSIVCVCALVELPLWNNTHSVRQPGRSLFEFFALDHNSTNTLHRGWPFVGRLGKYVQRGNIAFLSNFLALSFWIFTCAVSAYTTTGYIWEWNMQMCQIQYVDNSHHCQLYMDEVLGLLTIFFPCDRILSFSKYICKLWEIESLWHSFVICCNRLQ